MSHSSDQIAETTKIADEALPNAIDQVPEKSIPAPNDAPSDYSDAPLSGEQTSQQRRHRRGGRRKQSEEAEAHVPWSERNGRLKSTYEDAEEDGKPAFGDDNLNEEEESELERAERSSPDLRRKEEHTSSENTAKSSKTGVRAFNIKKAESSGGRPFGVTVERPKSKAKSKSQKKEKKQKKPRRRTESEDEEDSDEEEEPRKPLSIRLDLNLELEIFLKAKVKGDITITFLDS